ncbi:hypothetical protein [Lederbergia ruris]|uniref:hypothetical protein n=1 Tax=Lederbergia ruris TaxID=217495 RepID=UPI00399F9473
MSYLVKKKNDLDNKLNVNYITSKLKELDEVYLIGRNFGGELRSYNIGNSILICCDEIISLEICKSGKNINIYSKEKDINEACVYVIGVAFSISLIYRGYIPLHCSATCLEGKNIALIADSGVGKSTLLRHALNQGGKLITDDVLPIFVKENEIYGIPSRSIRPKLWEEELERNYIDQSICKEIPSVKGKYWISINPTRRCFSVTKMDALFLLKPYNDTPTNKVVLSRLPPSKVLFELLQNTHGLWAVSKEMYIKLLDTYNVIAKSVPCYLISYYKCPDAKSEIFKRIKSIC